MSINAATLPRLFATKKTVIRLYRNLFKEVCYFFDDHSRHFLWSRIRHKFSKYRNETDPAFIEHVYRRGKADLRRLRQANAGEMDKVMLVLKMAWGKSGEIMDAKINTVIKHRQIDKFPISPRKLSVASLSPIEFSDEKIDLILSTYPNLYPSPDSRDLIPEDSLYNEILVIDLDISRTHFDEGAEVTLRHSPADSRYIDFDYSKSVVHKAVTYPPYSDLPIRCIRYSGPFRALISFNKQTPKPQFPTPRRQYAAEQPELSVRRINNIEKRHFQKLLKKVKKNMAVDKYVIESALKKVTPLDRLSTSSGRKYKGMRYAYRDLPDFHKHLAFCIKDSSSSRYSVADQKCRRSSSPRPRYIRRRYESLIKISPVLQVDDKGNWKADTFRLPKKEPPSVEDWML
ncbi:hypothetical protein POJ06DRAFT_235752 [Lipomyces tetrasporus]|uniref:LYR motif-containing protein Cup1-like N-terminal domain-containing protein n=1 Tax=Lipomyces tetrasporus TaxID=54092 RepID=A0AAD7QXM5_9ASCO|nr:uncharacterized protein POJ06DRAFT_235752 [Lipomyces tetrasporus]KAJ8102801.1 hypothetical protein POJ06DRAFT_235752 [Lipomyces tetrasporus]